MNTLIALVVATVITLFFLRFYLKGLKKRDKRARAALEKGELFSEGPNAQHPHIDNAQCIGRGLCADACPVGAITMVMATPSMGADMPFVTPEHETSLENLFIVGELGGLALIKNAVNQGCECVDTIIARITPGSRSTSVYDLLIVGAGPAGISASLRAIENKLNYVTLEQDEVGGTVAKYPRQKLVMTSPVDFPMYGRFKKTELSKENLLAFWDTVLNRADFNVRTGEKVQNITKGPDEIFTVSTANHQYRARAVVLALGRGGTPRKLGVKGEELPKVMYRLIEADHYTNKKILVVGGGDSAVEAAMGLAHQPGNKVTLSYRQAKFSRIKERNVKRLDDCVRGGKIELLFKSNPIEFKPETVVIDVAGQVREIPNDFVWI